MSTKDELNADQIAALQAGFALEGTIALGDYVRTPSRHDHMGRVYQVHHTCPESPAWVKGLSIPVPEEKLMQPWVSILQHGGGAVVVPISDAVRIPPIPGFTHSYANMFFRDEAAPPKCMVCGGLHMPDEPHSTQHIDEGRIGLYDALVVLCQTQGVTTEHTYDLLHAVVSSIITESDGGDEPDDDEPGDEALPQCPEDCIACGLACTLSVGHFPRSHLCTLGHWS